MTFGRWLAVTVLCTVSCTASEEQAASFDRGAAAMAISAVLDALHHNASVADGEAYFALFAPEGVFFGTDITERWTVEQFRTYAMGRFAQGRGWTYVLRPGTRNIAFDPSGTVAWFDEILDNANYGATRGTGVLRLMDGQWKIAQYHLTIPVPNALADTVVRMVRALDGR